MGNQRVPYSPVAVRTRSKIQKELMKRIGHRLRKMEVDTLHNLNQEGQEFDQFLQEMVQKININETSPRKEMLRSISCSSSSSSSSSSDDSSSDSLLSYRTDCTRCNVRHSSESLKPETPDIHDDNTQMFPLDLSANSAQNMENEDVASYVTIANRPPTPWPIYTPSQSPRSDVSLPDIHDIRNASPPSSPTNVIRNTTPPGSPTSSPELPLQSNEVSSTEEVHTPNTQYDCATLNTELSVSINHCIIITQIRIVELS